MLSFNHSFVAFTLHHQLIMHIRRLLAFSPSLTRRKGAVKQKSSLLNLPLALVYDIFDELQWPEKVLLSQTCRDLWYTLRSQCSSAIRQATVAERVECLAVLGDILPDHRLCISCRALHLLDPKDLPVMSNDRFHKPCPASEDIWSRHRLMPFYSIAFRHVQLAIKYTRLTGVHQDYRASILRKYTISFPRSYSFTAEPVIAHGRFVLMTTRVFYKAVGPMLFSTLSQMYLYVCPHLGTGASFIPDSPLLAAIRFVSNVADGQRGLLQKGNSCDRCPTDFLMSIEDGRAILYVWQDLGAGTSSADPYWRSHIRDKENGLFKGTSFSYEYGSVRDLYYSRGT